MTMNLDKDKNKDIFEIIFDNAGDAIAVCNFEGSCVQVNETFCKRLGYSREELKHMIPMDLFSPSEAKLIPQWLVEIKRKGRILFETEHRCKDGTIIPTEIESRIITIDGESLMLSIARDITERKIAEEEVLRSKQEWEKTFNSMNDIVTIQDRNMRIVRANKVAYETLGMKDESIIGKLCHEVFAGKTEPCPECPALTRLDDVSNHSEIITHKKLGKTFHVSSSPILDENNKVQYFIHVAKDITEQQRHEDEWAMFSALVDQSNDAIYVIDPDTGIFLFANSKGYLNLGYDKNELVKLKVHDVAQNIQSDEDWMFHLESIRKNGFKVFETVQRRKDKSFFPVEVNARIISHNGQDFLVSVARDISERKIAEEKIYQEKNKLEAVVAALGDGLTHQDRNFKILYQNEVHKQKQGDHVGEFCYKAYQGKDTICEGCLLLKCFEDGKVHRRETNAKTADGVIYLEVSASPIKDGSGEIIGGIETVRDITERKLLEIQVQQGQKMEAIGTLAGGIAHDFNNILTGVLGYSEMAKISVQDGGHPEEYIDEVIKAAQRAAKLVQQILAFSRSVEHELKSIEPYLIVTEVVKMLRSSMPSSITIQENIDSDCGFVLADPTKLHQIVLNLCTNAMHAMENEKGILGISLYRTEIQESDIVEKDISSGSFIVLSVSDTGCGMGKETIEKIFDPYFTTKEVGTGTGIGLAVVQRIVKDYRGFIKVESEPGKGTCFNVCLPALQKNIATQQVEINNKIPKSMGSERVLIVDDEITIVNILKSVLERFGYKVTATTNSKEALEKIRSNADQFDLLITDQTMPGLTGFELAQEALRIKSSLPIILCTGYSAVITEEVVLAIGVKKYVLKPIDMKEFPQIVRLVLDGNKTKIASNFKE